MTSQNVDDEMLITLTSDIVAGRMGKEISKLSRRHNRCRKLTFKARADRRGRSEALSSVH